MLYDSNALYFLSLPHNKCDHCIAHSLSEPKRLHLLYCSPLRLPSRKVDGQVQRRRFEELKYELKYVMTEKTEVEEIGRAHV